MPLANRPPPWSSGHVAPPPDDLRGRLVDDGLGHVVGSIAELLPPSGHDCERYVLLACDGFLGLGELHYIVPWRALRSAGVRLVLPGGARGAGVRARECGPAVTRG